MLQKPVVLYLALLAALCLFAAACGDDGGQSADPITTSSTTTTSTTASSDSTTTTEPTAPVTLGSTCTSPDGFAISYPEDWEAVSECGQFGPAPLSEPAPGTDEKPGAVSAFVDPVAFGEVSRSVQGTTETERSVTAVDGLQAVRVVETTTGEGLLPAGTEQVRWLIDLAIGVDDGPGTLFLTAADRFDDLDFDQTVAILDAMARSLEIDAGDEPETQGVVARSEGGGTPITIAATGSASDPATCFRAIDADEGPACVNAVSEPDGIAITELSGHTVGIVGPEVFAVEARSGQGTVSVLPAPYPGRETSGFAVPFGPDELTGLTLLDHDGDVLAEPSPAEARDPVS